MKNNNEIPDKVKLEYEKAQDSAEHFDRMIWVLVSLGIGLSILILKMVLLEEHDFRLKLSMLGVGSMTLIFFTYIIESANEKKTLKYLICKKIEKDYRFIGQHRLVDKLTISGSLKRGQRWGAWGFRLIVIILFWLYAVSTVAITKLKTYASIIIFSSIIISTIVAILLFYFNIKNKKLFDSIYKN